MFDNYHFELCHFCGHVRTEHLGGEHECENYNCRCVEFEPPPDPSFRFHVYPGGRRTPPLEPKIHVLEPKVFTAGAIQGRGLFMVKPKVH